MTGGIMIEVENSGNEKSFETLNDMMVLLESSLYDVQIMVAQTIAALMEVMDKSSVEISCSVPMVLGGKSSILDLHELFFCEEEDIYQVRSADERILPWNELDISIQFEIVMQVHQKYVSEYRLLMISEQEEIH